MKKLIIIIILSSAILSIKAQPSGYMGKRFSASYSALVFLPLVHIAKDDKKLINYTHSLNFEYVLKQRQSIGFRVQKFNTFAYIRANSSEIANNFDATLEQNSSINESYKLNVFNIAIDYTFYRRGWIAPLGKYNKLSLIYMQYNSDNFLTNNKDVINTEEKVYDYTTAFTFTTGKRWIFNDMFTLHIASQFGLSMPFHILHGSSKNLFEKTSGRRIMSYMLYNFEVGTGIIF